MKKVVACFVFCLFILFGAFAAEKRQGQRQGQNIRSKKSCLFRCCWKYLAFWRCLPSEDEVKGGPAEVGFLLKQSRADSDGDEQKVTPK